MSSRRRKSEKVRNHREIIFIELVLFLALALILSSFVQASSLPKEAKSDLLKSNWTKLVPKIKEWKEKAPDNPVSWWLLGYGSLATGDYNTAMEAFLFLDKKEKISNLFQFSKSLANEYPNSPIALMLKGDALARSGRYNDAIEILNKAVEREPKSALFLNVRGVVKSLSDRPEEAIIDFEKSVKLDPHYSDPLVNIGLVRFVEYDLMGALLYLNRAIDLSPNFALAYNVRGLIYSQLQAWNKSEEDFLQAKKLSPKIPFFKRNAMLISWKKAQEQFHLSQKIANQHHIHRTKHLSTTYEQHSVHIGEGKTVDIIVIKDVPQTASLSGMIVVIQKIANKLYKEAGVPANCDWKPRILLAQTELGLHINASKMFFARFAFLSGKDFIISIDTTKNFKWPSISTDVSTLKINKEVSKTMALR